MAAQHEHNDGSHEEHAVPKLWCTPIKHTKVAAGPSPRYPGGEPPPPPPLTLPPLAALLAAAPAGCCLPSQVVHLIRHGQGTHNVAGHADAREYKSFEWLDAHLTAEGWRQVG